MAKKNKATWIWYPGDFEIWLGNRFNNRRTERGAMFPPFWKQDSPWATVEFSTIVDLAEAETIRLSAEGDYNLMIDGRLQFGMPSTFEVPSGRHRLNIKVHHPNGVPALFVEGRTIKTGATWLVTYEDKIWIDENGQAHGSGVYVYPGQWNFNEIVQKPSAYRLPRRYMDSMKCDPFGDGILVDFGCETMGYPILKDITGEGEIHLYYGESREEATDTAHAETLDKIRFDKDFVTDLASRHTTSRHKDYTLEGSKALRYIYIETHGPVCVGGFGIDYEYSPFDIRHSGSFRCNDEELNRIWDVSAYTMDLTTREFFTDGIKRDRWIWSGDAIQSYLMNYYLRFDTECVKRTIRQLRGKDPVTAHVNTIMDYTFFWFKSILDLYDYTGDEMFIREMYPRMRTLMDYCLQRTDENGLMAGHSDDWIFVDWVDFSMHKRGALSFEQLLFSKALETMAHCAALLAAHPLPEPPQGSLTTEQYHSDSLHYSDLAQSVMEKTRALFWSEERQAYLHALEDGELNEMVTKFPNIFAILYGYANKEEQEGIRRHVLLNEKIEQITTPYMRFYELAALCMTGEHAMVLKEIKSYWGGMLHKGATTFWEKYVPEESGTEHLAMYGRRYGKSLCHSWGASPIYLLGKYFLGVRPVKAGYEEFSVAPVFGGLKWMEGTVPTPNGLISVCMDEKQLKVHSDEGCGYVYLPEGYKVSHSSHCIETLEDGRNRIWLEASEQLVVKFDN
jgi:hypothetical protein